MNGRAKYLAALSVCIGGGEASGGRNSYRAFPRPTVGSCRILVRQICFHLPSFAVCKLTGCIPALVKGRWKQSQRVGGNRVDAK
jgi:hypothetical protein